MLSLLLSAFVTAGSAKRIELDWIIRPTNRPMQEVTAAVGDTIVFNWRGRHNVFVLPDCDGKGKHKWDSFQCPNDGKWGVELGESSPVEYTIPAKYNPGDYICFVCEVGGHCSAGQHTTLLVAGGDPKPQPEPSTEIGIDWRIPSNKMDKSMQLVHAAPGTTLTFTWRGFHNVWLMKTCGGKWDDFKCPTSQAEWNEQGENLGGDSPVSYTIPKDFKGDSVCFACEVGPHCSLGQYTTVVIKKDDPVMCCKAITATCVACSKKMTVEEVCKEAADKGDELAGCEAAGGDEPFETLANLSEFCSLAKQDDCKLCQGKFKKGKCAVKSKKLKKIKCKKVKDLAFCNRLGCKVSKKKQACGGKPKLA